ncbi:MAG: hypothetical protein E5W57_04095 [Mesorhizobium sp.]|nr:MAG: hypothetical protein E5W57_04095 [Mesorhizobium sp.]
MADYRTRENANVALEQFEAAAKGDAKWTALAFVLRVIVGLLLEIRGYSGIPIADLSEPDEEEA